MFPILTKYLLRHKTVCIPHVGRFDIVQVPAQLNVADKEIIAPVYQTSFAASDDVPARQLNSMRSVTNEADASSLLFAFGEKLRRQIQTHSLQWNGLGTLSLQSGQVSFAPEVIQVSALQPIPAQKVLRENVQHQVLVGDREMTSAARTETVARVRTKRPWYITAGWIVLVAAIAGVAIFLYLKHFQTTSTGMQIRW